MKNIDVGRMRKRELYRWIDEGKDVYHAEWQPMLAKRWADYEANADTRQFLHYNGAMKKAYANGKLETNIIALAQHRISHPGDWHDRAAMQYPIEPD